MWKPPSLPRVSVTLYDHNPFNRRIAMECLYRMGMTRITLPADTNELAHMIYHAGTPLTIVDWSNQKELQSEIFTILRNWQNARGDDQVLVLLTSDARESNIKLAAIAGCDAVVLKPFSVRGFCNRIFHAMQRRFEALREGANVQVGLTQMPEEPRLDPVIIP